MYKGFKSLKDIYKDKCNLHVTIPFQEMLRDQRVPLQEEKRGNSTNEDLVNVPQQD